MRSAFTKWPATRTVATGVIVTAVGSLGFAGSASAAQLLVDVGGAPGSPQVDTVGRSWTNINPDNDTNVTVDLLLTNGTDSGYDLTVSNPAGTTNAAGFSGTNTNGATGSTTPALSGDALARNYPAFATGDSGYGNSATFGAGIVQAVRLTLSNLNPLETYNLDFFASRTGVGDNRETEYHITGGAAGPAPTSVFLNVANNTGTIVGATGFVPDANGQIVIDIDAGPNNTNPTTFFYYLGALEINTVAAPVPEPGSLGLLALGGLGLLGRRRR
jgi:hypothetical protein